MDSQTYPLWQRIENFSVSSRQREPTDWVLSVRESWSYPTVVRPKPEPHRRSFLQWAHLWLPVSYGRTFRQMKVLCVNTSLEVEWWPTLTRFSHKKYICTKIQTLSLRKPELSFVSARFIYDLCVSPDNSAQSLIAHWGRWITTNLCSMPYKPDNLVNTKSNLKYCMRTYIFRPCNLSFQFRCSKQDNYVDDGFKVRSFQAETEGNWNIC